MPVNKQDVKKTEKKETKSSSLDSNETTTAVLSYLSFLVFIPLLSIDKAKRNDFIKFHLEQGLNLFVLEVIFFVALNLLSWAAGFFGIIAYIVNALFVIVSIIAIIKAMNKEKWNIPVVENLKMIKL